MSTGNSNDKGWWRIYVLAAIGLTAFIIVKIVGGLSSDNFTKPSRERIQTSTPLSPVPTAKEKRRNVETRIDINTFTRQDVFDEGYSDGYTRGEFDARKGNNHGCLYDDSNDFKDHYEDMYKQGYEEGYDDGYNTGFYEDDEDEDTFSDYY